MKTFDEAMEFLFNNAMVFVDIIMSENVLTKADLGADYTPCDMLHEFSCDMNFHIEPMIDTVSYLYDIDNFTIATKLDLRIMEYLK